MRSTGDASVPAAVMWLELQLELLRLELLLRLDDLRLELLRLVLLRLELLLRLRPALRLRDGSPVGAGVAPGGAGVGLPFPSILMSMQFRKNSLYAVAQNHWTVHSSQLTSLGSV